MRNMLGKRVLDEEVQDHEHYYGHKCCGQCMWFTSESPEGGGQCSYREWAEKNERPVSFGHGRDIKEEIWSTSDGCLEWFD